MSGFCSECEGELLPNAQGELECEDCGHKEKNLEKKVAEKNWKTLYVQGIPIVATIKKKDKLPSNVEWHGAHE
jgi:DNA-directed RNA polymerase subunit M/transcription elongation factor TFIIS